MLLKKNLKIKLVLKENIVTLCNFSINSSEYSRFHDPASLACFSRDLANYFLQILEVFLLKIYSAREAFRAVKMSRTALQLFP